jgi:hypothetical protein
MKLSFTSAILAFAASAVNAQDNYQTGPFALHITGKTNSSIDGYVSACHAGAAIEALCYAEGPAPTGRSLASTSFFFNYTGYQDVGGAQVGVVYWNLPLGNQSVPEPLRFIYAPNSNVAAPMFYPSEDSTLVGFDADDKLFTYNYYDDSTFVPGVRPDAGESKAYYNWYLCWQYLSGYYYQSVGWSTTLPPQNPTCQAIDITQVLL